MILRYIDMYSICTWIIHEDRLTKKECLNVRYVVILEGDDLQLYGERFEQFIGEEVGKAN